MNLDKRTKYEKLKKQELLVKELERENNLANSEERKAEVEYYANGSNFSKYLKSREKRSLASAVLLAGRERLEKMARETISS